MKKKIKSLIKKFSEIIFKFECFISSKWVTKAHKHLKWAEWRIPPQPEFFDHHIDLYYQWLDTRNPLWLERGIFGRLALKGGRTLELACGDGFNARNFYSSGSREIVACDFDPRALKIALSKNLHHNIKYVQADIRCAMPEGKFDNIVWDAAIEHFTPKEIGKILRDIKNRLNSDGVLSGYTIVEKKSGEKSLSHHEYEFKSKEDLMGFISPYFKNIKVFETIYSNRHNLYFWASDEESAIPFSNEWPNAINLEHEFSGQKDN